MTYSDYQRLVIAFHGCDARIADRIARGGILRTSLNDYDWLGRGIYFWEHGPARALEWARFMATRKTSGVKRPAVVGALIQLGNCFDLLDVKFTAVLKAMYPRFLAFLGGAGKPLPKNTGVLHHLDCAFLNWAIPEIEQRTDARFQTVRGVFIEGEAVFPGGHILEKSHIQIAVRDPGCIVGYFHPARLHEAEI